MLQKLQGTFFSRHLFLLIALLIFNASVDAPDTPVQIHALDLAANDQETILEMVFEKILDMEDAFAETDDNNGEKEQKLKSDLKHQLFMSQFSIWSHFLLISPDEAQEMPSEDQNLHIVFREINSPPPEA